MFRVAIQISGQLRNWYTCSKVWKSVKDRLQSNNYQVDFYLTTWKEDYSVQMLEAGMLDFCVDVNLVEYTKGTYIEGERLEAGKIQGEKRPIGSSLYSEAVYHASSNRRKYQKNHNLDYDIVIAVRPDILKNKLSDWVVMCDYLVSQRSPLNIVHFAAYGATYGEDKTVFCYRWSSDTLVAGTQLSMDLFCLHYMYIFFQEEPFFIQQAHTAPAVGTMLFNLVPSTNSLFNCKIVRLDDFENYDMEENGEMKKIDKEYIESWKIE